MLAADSRGMLCSIRSPGYFRPKVNFEYSFLQRLLFRIPGVLRLYRWKIYLEYDRNILSRGTGTWTSDLRERMTTVRCPSIAKHSL